MSGDSGLRPAGLAADAGAEALDPVGAPLAPFGGARPPAPAWFEDALAVSPERTFLQVDGAPIEVLAWGQVGDPGLLLLHGAGANADWWSFIAPFFAEHRRVAALSFSGMGRSGWRDRYSIEGFVQECLAAAEAANLFGGSSKPVVAAHSFGGTVAADLAAREGSRFSAVVIVDSGARPPEDQWRGPPRRTRPNAVYPTLAAALARFRLMPPQTGRNPFILDHIAREGLVERVSADGTPGWSWRFDPFMWSKMDVSRSGGVGEALARAKCRLAFVWGARSRIMTREVIDYSRACAPFATPFIEIPEAEHHVLLDEPLALVSVLRSLLAVWSET